MWSQTNVTSALMLKSTQMTRETVMEWMSTASFTDSLRSLEEEESTTLTTVSGFRKASMTTCVLGTIKTTSNNWRFWTT